jgi:periplasmic protein TonB
VTKDPDVQASTADPVFHDWEPRELGLPWATLMAIVLAGAIMAFCYFVSTALGPKAQMQVIQVTRVTLTQLPRPMPPPPPKVVPPPRPIPAVIPKPPPVASKIVVPTKPPPVIHPIHKPVRHVVINHTLPPPTPAPVSHAPQPMAPAPTSGVPVYGNQMYSIIQANQNVPPALAQLGVSGTVVIEIMVAPDGHVISARVYKSSGVPLVDQTALEHAKDAALPPFNNEMPQQPRAFLIPIEISPQPSTD